MRRSLYMVAAMIAALSTDASAQDDTEQRIRKALEGRPVLVKMDMPAIETGVEMVFNDADVSFDKANYNKQIKEYGVSLKKGHRARITGVRISPRGIEIDLDGGGSPGRDWLVGDLRLVEPAPVVKSDREIELERQLSAEPIGAPASWLRSELDYERQRRLSQDERNRMAFDRVSRVRTNYIEENRKDWGARLIIVVRSRKESVTMHDMVKSLARYAELLPRETTPGQ